MIFQKEICFPGNQIFRKSFACLQTQTWILLYLMNWKCLCSQVIICVVHQIIIFVTAQVLNSIFKPSKFSWVQILISSALPFFFSIQFPKIFYWLLLSADISIILVCIFNIAPHLNEYQSIDENIWNFNLVFLSNFFWTSCTDECWHCTKPIITGLQRQLS